MNELDELPYHSMVDLAKELRKNGFSRLQHQQGNIYQDVINISDMPDGKTPRMTYITMLENDIKSYVVFVMSEPMKGKPCFNVGYATPKRLQRNGFSEELIVKSIEELSQGLVRSGVNDFYIEAIVSEGNIASQHLASKLISPKPLSVKDANTNLPVFAYVRHILN